MADLCLVCYTYRGYPLAHALERAQAFGFRGVELRDLSDIDLSTPAGLEDALSRAMPLARALGLKVYATFLPLPVSRADERAAEEASFAEMIAVLGRWEVPILHTHLDLRDAAGRRVVSAGAREEDYAAAGRALSRLATVAERHGVRIAPETHMGTIHDTAAAQLRLIHQCPFTTVAASLDFANMLITYPGEHVAQTPTEFGARIGYVHIKNVKLLPHGMGYDWNLPLRAGDINYRAVLQALKESGYHGPLALEYCGTGDPDVFVEDDAHYLKGLAVALGL